MKKFLTALAAAHVLGAALFFGACSGGGDNPIAYIPPAGTTTAGGENATTSGGTAAASSDGAIVLSSAASISLAPWSYEVKCKVPDNNNEDWTAELVFDDEDDFSGENVFLAEFGYIHPTSGKGEGTIKLCALDPSDNSSRSGKIVIKYSGGTTVSVPVTQEGSPKNESSKDERVGRKKRGIGYGYNAFLGYASSNCFRNALFKLDDLESDDGIIIEDGDPPVQILYSDGNNSTKYREESGSNVAELEAHLNASVNASAEYCGFSAELESAFKQDYKTNENCQFSWADTITTAYEVYIDNLTTLGTLSSPKVLTKTAYKMINNTDGRTKNFFDIIKAYGTHVVVGGYIGGKMHVDMTADISKISSSYDITAMIKAGYEGTFGKAGGKVDAAYNKTVTNDKDAFTFNSSVSGGSSDTQSEINTMLSTRKLDSAKTKLWTDSLKNINNCVFVEFVSEESLVPIYELVDTDLKNGDKRYDEFVEYFNGKMKTDIEDYYNKLIKKQTQYVTSAPAKIDIPEWGARDPSRILDDRSLIRDVYIDNSSRVARITNEFIPQLNAKERVTVVYPATNTKVFYNMGYFVGDSSHKPHSVSWNGSKPVLMEHLNDTKDYGAVSCLYIKSLNMSVQQPDYLEGGKQPFGTSQSEVKLNAGKNGEYHTVKILDKIYTRRPWDGEFRNDGVTTKCPFGRGSYGSGNATNRQGPRSECYGVCYYADINYIEGVDYAGGFCPAGWEVPYDTYFKEILDALDKVKDSLPEASLPKAFITDGVLGLNLVDKTGYFSYKRNGLEWHDDDASFLGARKASSPKTKTNTNPRLVIAKNAGTVTYMDSDLGGAKEYLYGFPLIFCQPCQ